MPKEWYVSFHGGEEKASLNNIHVYSADGKKLRKALNKESIPDGITLRELRGFVFGPDRNLYVVNAYFKYSEVLKFKGELNKDGQHDFTGVFVKHHPDMNPGIDHPFNVTFDSEGDLYVSSQNTNLIARYHGPASKTGRPGTPMPFPESLDLDVDLPPGTFVPSAKVASNGLLEVRGVIFSQNNDLYVADRAADCVRIYQARTGRHLRNLSSKSDQLDKPIHLLLSPDGRYLLIGSGGNDSILRHDIGRNSTSVFIAPKSGGLNGPAGIAFGDDGFLYVASRNTKEILRYDGKDGRPSSKPFIKNLADNPEFLMLVGQIPLNHAGQLVCDAALPNALPSHTAPLSAHLAHFCRASLIQRFKLGCLRRACDNNSADLPAQCLVVGISITIGFVSSE